MFLNSYRRRLGAEALMRQIVAEERESETIFEAPGIGKKEVKRKRYLD